MRAFSPAKPIMVELGFRDRSGVGRVVAFFSHTDSEHFLVLSGNGKGQTEAAVVLTPSESGPAIVPGEYRCRGIEAWDITGHSSVFTPETHPRLADERFRYEYPPGASDDTEGPELVD